MKKKLILAMLILVLALSVVMGAVACGGTTPPPKDPEVPPPPPEKEWKTITVDQFAETLVMALDNTVNTVAAVDNKLYADATLYVIFNDINVELRIAGTFDEDVADNNKGLIALKVGGQDKLTVYVEKSVVYIGEALTQDTVSWTKLNQVESANIISQGFMKLPGLFTDDEGEPLLGQDLLSTLIGVENLGMVGLADPLFATQATKEFNYSEAKFAADYKTTLQLGVLKDPKIKGLLEGFLKGDDGKPVNIEEFLGTLPEPFPTVIGIVVPLLLNGSITDLFDPNKTLVFPEISIVASIDEDTKLNSIGIIYDNTKFEDEEGNPGAYVEFGLKNVTISTDSAASVKPATMPSNVEPAVIKLSAGINVPGKDLQIDITGYIKPEMELVTDNQGKITGLDLTDVYGYAVANINGEPVDLGVDFNRKQSGGTNQVRIDLSGLMNELGVAIDENDTYYINFDLDAWFNGLDFGVQPANAGDSAEPQLNDLDKLLNNLFAAFKSETFDPIGLVMGNYNYVFNIAKDLGVVFDAAINEDGRLEVAALLSGLLNSNIVKNSTTLADRLAEIFKSETPINPADYIGTDVVIGNIASLFGDDYTVEEMAAVVTEYTGFEFGNDVEADFLALELGLAGIRTNEKGLGASFGIYSGDTLVVEIYMAADVVGDNVVPNEYFMTSGFSYYDDNDLATKVGQDKIIDTLLAILKAYKG